MTAPTASGSRRRLPDAAAPPRPVPWFRRLAGDLAEERAYRALAFGFLPAAVLFGLLAAPTAVAQRDAWPSWWTAGAFVLGVAPSIALGATAFVLPLTVLRRIARIDVVCTLVAQASIPLVVQQPLDPLGQAWFLQVGGLGLIAATLATSSGPAVLVQLAGAVLIFTARQFTDPSGAVLQGLEDGLYLLLFTLTFVALGVGALTAGRTADEEEAGALQQARAAAADAAREREQARIDALVHDRVLATLLAAGRHVPGSAAMERRDATRALDGLHALLHDEEVVEAASGEAVVHQIQAITTALSPEAGFGFDLLADRTVPGEVADALLQAAEEALRNSLKHSGGANRTVHVRIDDHGACVDVLDDGVGFDRDAVPASRLGISESIEGRMRALPGGSAAVVTRSGVGTRVRLQWLGR